MKNDIFISLELKGLIMNATTIHDWSDYIPSQSKSDPKEDFTVFGDSSTSIIAKISDIAIDYTPCVTNNSILSVYKNYKYKINPDDNESDDSDDEDIGNKFYKTNTRLITILGQATMQLNLNQKKVEIKTKLLDISNHLLYTRDSSHKWS